MLPEAGVHDRYRRSTFQIHQESKAKAQRPMECAGLTALFRARLDEREARSPSQLPVADPPSVRAVEPARLKSGVKPPHSKVLATLFTTLVVHRRIRGREIGHAAVTIGLRAR